MEFHEKLQNLRKQKGITQEELAEALYVSRTAVSKWESGRGYPSIDSLKALAAYFSVTIDELLSGAEVLTIAEADNRQKENRLQDLVFGLLDVSVVLLLVLPFFGQRVDGQIQAVSLLGLVPGELYLKVVYWIAVLGTALLGGLILWVQRWNGWVKHRKKLSLAVNALSALLFIVSMQPYPAALLFVYLAIKVLLVLKWQ